MIVLEILINNVVYIECINYQSVISLQFFVFNMVACGIDLSLDFAWITDGENWEKFISEYQNNTSIFDIF